MKLVCLLLAVFWGAAIAGENTQTKNTFCTTKSETKLNTYHQDESFINIGGIKQWVAIRTKNCQGPLLLIIHGGPGNPTSHYTNSYIETLEQHFILVHWDQRGSGRTFSNSLADANFDDYLKTHHLNAHQMVQDGIELSEYLLSRFSYLNKKKVILKGGSWGSFLALDMARQRPDLYHAFVGHSQLINAKDKHLFGYQESMRLAKASQQEELITLLETLGEPPYDHPRKYGQLYRVIKTFERNNATPSTLESSLLKEYGQKVETKRRYMADDYSWMHFIGFERLGIKGMLSDVDLNQYPTAYKLPIYIIQGKHDLTTPEHSAKEYFDKITAPAKAYFLIPDAAHEPNDGMINTERDILLNKILPTIR